MNNSLLQIKIKERLNKLGSFDYDNLQCWQIAEAFNKAQMQWVNRQIYGLNPSKQGGESNFHTIDELRVLIVEHSITGNNNNPVYFESDVLPENYIGFKRISIHGKTDTCPPRTFVVYLAAESDADMLLVDRFSKPSFEWGETFGTLIGNKLRIYTNGTFDVVDPKLVYYRKPLSIQFEGCLNLEENSIATANVECEFKDNIVELLIDDAAAILAGDIESITQYQRLTQDTNINS
jgi:hypothetical protein